MEQGQHVQYRSHAYPKAQAQEKQPAMCPDAQKGYILPEEGPGPLEGRRLKFGKIQLADPGQLNNADWQNMQLHFGCLSQVKGHSA